MQKSFKLDQAFMNNIEKCQTALQYFKYVNTQFRILLSQNIENQRITTAKYTVLMLCVRQNERKKAFGRSPPYQK